MKSEQPVKTILILAANPKGSVSLRLDEEVREIEAGLQRSIHRNRFVLKSQFAIRPRDVRRAMLDYKPQIVHFCGHGEGEQGLVWEDENGEPGLVSTEALANLFKLFADQVECVLLNACYSEVQARAIAQHIGSVIGMNQAIGDRAAIEFAVSFYDALGAGESIEFAFRLGCTAIPGNLTPVLFPPRQRRKGKVDGIDEPPPRKHRWFKLLGLAIVAAIVVILLRFCVLPAPVPELAGRLSLGEHLLISETTQHAKCESENVQLAKREGADRFAARDYDRAKSKFKESLNQCPNDPEARIYLNNATVRASQRPLLRLAVAVPIGGNVDVAQEMLRGVAQAQDKINNQPSGIGGAGLEVRIANDDNNPAWAEAIAQELVNDDNVLAVIGHNASDASVRAAEVYQKGRLVMITPTSFANKLSGFGNNSEFGNYIFRTIPSGATMAQKLTEHIKTIYPHPKLALCYDSHSQEALSFKEGLEKFLLPQFQFNCDFFPANSFNPEQMVDDAIQQQADALVLAPHIERMEGAIKLMQENHRKLPLFSNTTLSNPKTLNEGKEDAEGMILPVPWHRKFATPSFVKDAKNLWGTDQVSWRTASSFDATTAAIEALKNIAAYPTQRRDRIQKTLLDPSFQTDGSGGSIQFSTESNSKKGEPILVKVEAPSGKDPNYTFEPLSTSTH